MRKMQNCAQWFFVAWICAYKKTCCVGNPSIESSFITKTYLQFVPRAYSHFTGCLCIMLNKSTTVSGVNVWRVLKTIDKRGDILNLKENVPGSITLLRPSLLTKRSVYQTTAFCSEARTSSLRVCFQSRVHSVHMYNRTSAIYMGVYRLNTSS